MNNLNNLSNLNDLEYRLWLLQGEVNQALQNVDQAAPIDKNRLDHMASEISYLQRQVTAMRELGTEKPEAYGQPSPFAQPQAFPPQEKPAQPQQGPQPQKLPLPYRQPQPQQRPLPYGQPLPQQEPLPQGSPLPQGGPLPYGQPLPQGNPLPPEALKKDLEKTLGTGVMGIAASILIFISIIIFGGLLLPYLTDAFMTAIMFLLSFLLFGAGALLLRKDSKNKFYISLCACGATAICVSLFVTRLYFELINDMVFLALIAVWLALMAFICKQYQNHIFRIIGESGVFLTACFGMARLIADETADDRWFMYCILLAVFGSSTLIFNYVGRSWELYGSEKQSAKCERSSLFHRIIPVGIYEKNAFSHTIRSLAFLLFSVAFVGETGPGMGVYAGFAFMSAFLCLEIYMSYGDVLHDGCLFYCLMCINVLVYCAIFCKTFEVESYLPYYITAILLAGLFELKQSKNSMFGSVLVCLIFWGSGWAWLHESVFYTLLVMLPLFAYGYVRKSKAALYIGLFSIAAVFTADITVLSMTLLWAVPFICFVVLARMMENQIFTAVGYPVFMTCGADVLFKLLKEFDFRYGQRMIIVFLILSVIHILLVKGKVFAEDGKVFEAVAAFMTVCFMVYSAYAVYEEYLNVLTMLVMAGLYTMNTVNLLKRSEHFGYYIGFKYTVLMILLVDSHFEMSMLLSVLMLLFAAGSIAFGFYKSYKSFRIYGLILSMVSVFKLILFDVSSKSALYNAVGFLACGLICFGISFLYNKIERKVEKK